MDETIPIKRGRGRPKGSKNKPKIGAIVPVQASQAAPAAQTGPETTPDLSPDGIKAHEDPLQFLLGVMNNPTVDPRLRVRAAVTACQYRHTRRADGGKREEQAERAEQASRGRFATPKKPTLAVSNT